MFKSTFWMSVSLRAALAVLFVALVADTARGQTPTNVKARTEIDWKDGRVRIKATLLPESRKQSVHLLDNKSGKPKVDLPTVSRSGDEITIQGSVKGLARYIQPGKRQIWLGHRADVPRYHVEFPPVVLHSVQTGAGSEKQLVLELSTTGLLPDFQILGGKPSADQGEPPAPRPMRSDLFSVTRRDERDVVVLKLPMQPDQARSLRLTLVNGDGSASETFVVHCQGAKLTKLERGKDTSVATTKKGEPSATPAGATAKPNPIPTAPAEVVNKMTPDLVRVPAALGPVEAAVSLLGQQSLRTQPLGKRLPDDRVVGQQPAAKSWVTPASAVELTIERKVPPLAGSVGEAREKLRAGEFAEGLPGGFRSDDAVVDQSPKAGTYVLRGTRIALEVRRPVPNVEGKPVEVAVATLTERGFAARHYTASVRQDSIYSQQPKARQLVALGTPIELTLVRRVPPVEKAQLNRAVKLLETLGLRGQIETEGGVDGETAFVAEQMPEARREILLTPDFRDLEQLVVKLRPGSKIPQLLDDDLELAQRKLASLRLRANVAAPFAAGRPQTVTGHTYNVGDIVRFGTSVELQTRLATVRIPPIVGKPLSVAVEMLEQAGLRHRVGYQSFPEIDFVADAAMFSTDSDPPVAPGLAFPGSHVQLTLARRIPPLEGMPVDAAVELLKRIELPFKTLGRGVWVGKQAPRQEFIDPQRGELLLALGNKVPPVKGFDIEPAMGVLAENGFRGFVVRNDRVQTHDGSLIGRTLVADQLPAVGQIHPVGEMVRLVLVTYIPPPVRPPHGDSPFPSG